MQRRYAGIAACGVATAWLLAPWSAGAGSFPPPGHHFDNRGRLVHDHLPKARAPRKPVNTLVVYVPVAVAVPAAPLERILTGDKRALDGESLEWERTRIRLRGIDAPYVTSPQGEPARRRLQELLDAAEVTMQPFGYDNEGRTLAIVRADGVDVAQILKSEGFLRKR